eukprot:830279-Rhodomonas_salina.1
MPVTQPRNLNFKLNPTVGTRDRHCDRTVRASHASAQDLSGSRPRLALSLPVAACGLASDTGSTVTVGG